MSGDDHKTFTINIKKLIDSIIFVLQAEKRSLYVDMRDDDDTMDNWDEDKLKEVVEKKHGDDKSRPTTDIVRNLLCIFLETLVGLG